MALISIDIGSHQVFPDAKGLLYIILAGLLTLPFEWCSNFRTEFHRQSTRYTNTTSDLLRIFSDRNSIPHREPKGFSDQIAYKTVRFLRVASDMYFKDELVYRAMMLETVAAVPGYVL